jgi:hypothetical protein
MRATRRCRGANTSCPPLGLPQLSIRGRRFSSKGNPDLVFRNRHLIRVAVLGILIGLGISWVWVPSLLVALGGLVIFIYSAWLLLLEGRGIIMDEQTPRFRLVQYPGCRFLH